MKITHIKIALLLIAAILVTACSGSAHVKIVQQFPTVISEPRDIKAAIVFDQTFSTYVARPAEDISIDIGTAQVDLLSNAFRGLFQQVQTVTSRDQLSPDTELVIIPSVLQVQLSTPSDFYLNVYEVWIKYNLDVETAQGDPIDSWFMPAYGKSPNSMLASKSDAIEQATIMAIRDAGAKLQLDFFRIPSVYGWLDQQQKLEQ
jgi:hypothetical protein